jgi:hypothetical protein
MNGDLAPGSSVGNDFLKAMIPDCASPQLGFKRQLRFPLVVKTDKPRG